MATINKKASTSKNVNVKSESAVKFKVGSGVALATNPKEYLGSIKYFETVGGVELASINLDDNNVLGISYPIHELVLAKKVKPTKPAIQKGDWVTHKSAHRTGEIPRSGAPVQNIGSDGVSVEVAHVGPEARTIPVPVPHLKKVKAPKIAKNTKHPFEMTAQEQNAAYAKMAAKYAVGTKVRELNIGKREGVVAIAAAEGSGWIGVKFEGALYPLSKFVGDLKLVEKAPKAPKAKFKTNDGVWHPTHGVGVVCGASKIAGVLEVNFDMSPGEDASDVEGIEVHQDELSKAVFKKADAVADAIRAAYAGADTAAEEMIWVATRKKPSRIIGYVDGIQNDVVDVGLEGKGHKEYMIKELILWVKKDVPVQEAEVAPKTAKIKFDDVNLFGAFVTKGKTFVKVSKSNAIAVVVCGLPVAPFAMLATDSAKLSTSAISRFKKTDKVALYTGELNK